MDDHYISDDYNISYSRPAFMMRMKSRETVGGKAETYHKKGITIIFHLCHSFAFSCIQPQPNIFAFLIQGRLLFSFVFSTFGIFSPLSMHSFNNLLAHVRWHRRVDRSLSFVTRSIFNSMRLVFRPNCNFAIVHRVIICYTDYRGEGEI